MLSSTISLKKLKVDTGHCDKIMNQFEDAVSECEKEGYSKEVGRLLRLIVDFGFMDYEDWTDKAYDAQRDQINNAAIWANIFVIRLNNVAQKHLNNITMPPIHVQLNESLELAKFLKGAKFSK